MIACNGVDMGQPILAGLPIISERVAHHKTATVIPVATDKPTVWEAVNARLSCVFEVGTDDPTALNGLYLWEPGAEGVPSSGSGRALYTLDVAKEGVYTLAARVLSPTPENDSFFIRITAEDSTDILPEADWHLGQRKAWGWVDLRLSGMRTPHQITLPKGRVHVILRTREMGTKIDQLRLTPL
jgi:hypothetical protein